METVSIQQIVDKLAVQIQAEESKRDRFRKLAKKMNGRKAKEGVVIRPSMFIKPINDCAIKSKYSSIIPSPEDYARSIMLVLKQTGDELRYLSWEEYKKEVMRPGQGIYRSSLEPTERKSFERVAPYCENPDTVRLFSGSWNKIVVEHTRRPSLKAFMVSVCGLLEILTKRILPHWLKMQPVTGSSPC